MNLPAISGLNLINIKGANTNEKNSILPSRLDMIRILKIFIKSIKSNTSTFSVSF